MPTDLPSDLPFDALIFDLDGTLLASDELFHRAALRAHERLAAERGGTPQRPTREHLASLLGLTWGPLLEGVAPGCSAEERDRIGELLAEEEVALLRELGDALLFERVLPALELQRQRGVRFAVASNCVDFYLQGVLEHTGLGALIERGWCLSSPDVRDKSEMVLRALEHFGTKKAAMIGDRAHDAEAARANGLPFLAFGGVSYGAADEIRGAPRFDDYADFDTALRDLARLALGRCSPPLEN